MYLVEDLLVFQNVYQGKNKYGSHVNGQGYQEHEKVSVVTTSDAVVDPRTVMIKDLKQRHICREIMAKYGSTLKKFVLDTFNSKSI